MTVHSLINKLIEIRDRGLGDKKVIYSIDDEGNGYKLVYFNPSLVIGEEYSYDSIEVKEVFNMNELYDDNKINFVCIN